MPKDKKVFPLFWDDIKKLNEIAYTTFQTFEDDFVAWCNEILEESRKTFKEDDSCLLPKTPSAKRKQRGNRKISNKPSPKKNILVDFEENEDTGSEESQTQAKRSKGARKRLQAEVSDDDDDFHLPNKKVIVEEEPIEQEEEIVPVRSTRATRAASRAATASSRAKNTKKTSKANKKKKNAITLDLTADTDDGSESLASSEVDQKPDLQCTTPTDSGKNENSRQTRASKDKTSKSLEAQQTSEPGSCVIISVPKTPIQNFSAMNVKDKVQAYESIASNTPVQKSATKSDNMQTPARRASNDTHKTPDTIVSKKTTSVTESEMSFEHYEEIVYEEIPALPGIGPNGLSSAKKDTPRISNSRKSHRTSIRKSLKMLPSNMKLMNHNAPAQEEEKPVRTRTRLRLKKNDKEKESTTESSEENEFVHIHQDTLNSTYTEVRQNLSPEQDVDSELRRNTRVIAASNEKETVVRKLRNSHTSNESVDTDENKDSDNEGDSEPLEFEDLSVPSTNTTKQRVTGSKMRQPIVNQELQEQSSVSDENHQLRRSTRKKIPPSVETESMDMDANKDSDNENDSEHVEFEERHVQSTKTTDLPRATRSKMRQPPVSEEQPETRSTRTKTRKRQLEEESDTVPPLPKRSRSIIDKATLSDQDKTPTRKSHDSSRDGMSEDEIRSPSCPSNKVVRPQPKNYGAFGNKMRSPPCPLDKVVRPHQTSFLTKMKPLNTTPLSAARINPGLVRSFIPGHSPAKKPTAKEIQERRKKELMEKERKRLEVQRKREEEHKKKTEEIKKKREERLRKAQETREEKEKREKENRLNIVKKMEEKRQLTLKSKEEKMKEEKEKQRMRLQKFEEAEERRKQEEEERKKKLVEQRENEKFVADLMHRKKEFEEQERQKKIELEKQKALERRLELEKEREREQAKLKAVEEEKQREWIKKKEERERLLAKEKAEREKIELEKKKERDLQLKKEMEKLKEQERLRIAEEERIREQQKKQDLELKKMVDKHNAQVQNQQKQLPKPNLNRTHSVDEPNTSQGRNDSYEMTPDRVYKPTTGDNYNIDDIKSDDDTDDDEAPRKQIPEWAQGTQLKSALIKQHLHPPDLDLLFDPIQPPDLNKMFAKKRERFNKRTSSAHWDSPILKPGLLGRT